MKTPNVDALIVKISCETTGVSESEAKRQIGMIGPERKLELIETILGHMDLYSTTGDADKLSDMKKVIKRKKG